MSRFEKLPIIFEMLMYAFRSVGPYSAQDSMLRIPLENGITLAYLRGLLTLHVVLHSPSKLKEQLAFDDVDQSFFAQQFLKYNAGIDGKLNDEFRAVRVTSGQSDQNVKEEVLETNSTWLWGIGDTLETALLSVAASGYSNGMDGDEFEALAERQTMGLLEGTKHRSRYDFVLTEINREDFDRQTALKLQEEQLLDFFDTHENWEFWKIWLGLYIKHETQNDELLVRVLMINEEVWEDGPEAVAAEITRIKRTLLSNKAPLAEKIEFNSDTGKFRAVPEDIVKPDLVSATLSQLSDALEDVLFSPSNGLTVTSREVRVIQRTLGKYSNDPQQIELNLASVADGLRRQIFLSKELPETEENLGLLKTAEDGAVAIRATHPAVAENREILARQKFAELPDSDKSFLEMAKAPLVLLSEAQIADDFEQDIPELLNTSIGPSGNYAPPLPGVTRTFGRIARISEKLDDEDVLDKIKGHKGYKSVEVLLTGEGLVRLFEKLVEIGLRLLGGAV